jgi:hypothetical protein
VNMSVTSDVSRELMMLDDDDGPRFNIDNSRKLLGTGDADMYVDGTISSSLTSVRGTSVGGSDLGTSSLGECIGLSGLQKDVGRRCSSSKMLYLSSQAYPFPNGGKSFVSVRLSDNDGGYLTIGGIESCNMEQDEDVVWSRVGGTTEEEEEEFGIRGEMRSATGEQSEEGAFLSVAVVEAESLSSDDLSMVIVLFD